MESDKLQAISYTVKDRIATITLNCPAQKNALNLAMPWRSS